MDSRDYSFEFERDRDLAVRANGNKFELFDPLDTWIISIAFHVEMPADMPVTRRVLIHRAADVVVLRCPFALIYDVKIRN